MRPRLRGGNEVSRSRHSAAGSGDHHMSRRALLRKATAAAGAAAIGAASAACEPKPPEVRALALAGGGARGDFEVGAVRFLYNRGWFPKVICGSSVGAINSAKLAERSDHVRALTLLEDIWFSLQQNRDMYEKEAWLSQLEDSRLAELLEAVGRAGPVAPQYSFLLGPLKYIAETKADLGKAI